MKKLYLLLVVLTSLTELKGQFILAGDTSSNTVNYKCIDFTQSVGLGSGSGFYPQKYYLDVNNDNVSDYIILMNRNGCMACNDFKYYIRPLNNNMVSVNSLPFQNDLMSIINNKTSFIDTLNINDIIDKNLYWYSTNDSILIEDDGWNIANHGGFYYRDYYYSGNWFGHPKYVGLKMNFDNNFYYGWLRIAIQCDSIKAKISIYDCALSITNTNINDFKDISFKVYPNPASEKIILEKNMLGKQSIFKIFNISSELLVSGKIADKKTQIDISNLRSGVYIIEFINDSNIEIKKIIKK